MTEAKTAFVGSVPTFYEDKLRPVFFEPYAVDLARRATTYPGPILELACGTGIVTRRLLEAGGESLSITATDLNPPMLEEAQRRVPADARLRWQQADMTALPFEDATFGTVVCQFGFMFPPDKEAIYREARRVLRPGGALVFNVWGPLEDNPANPATLEALRTLFPENPPTFLQVPFGYHDEAKIRAQLGSQGFGDIRCERLVLPCRAASARDVAIGLVQGTPLAADLQGRGADFAQAEQVVEEALARLGGTSPFQDTMMALVFEAQAT